MTKTISQLADGGTISDTTVFESENPAGVSSGKQTAAQILAYITAARPVRERLAATRNYYVRTDGNDSNNGLSNSSGGAFKTIQKGVDTAASAIDAYLNVTQINVADGTYDEYVQGRIIVGANWYGIGVTQIIGNETTPSNVVCQGFQQLGPGMQWYVSGFKFGSPASAAPGGIAVSGHAQGWVRLGKVEFGSGNIIHCLADHRGTIEFMNSYTISGGATEHLFAANFGYILLNAVTVTLTGTPAFSTVFAFATDNSLIACVNGLSFSGNATGGKFLVANNSGINTGGGGAGGSPDRSGVNFFPGNVAGGADATSYYV